MKINEVAKLSGVTVRTLHYYDQIGLLPPSEITETGYRIYNNQALDTLQQILFFRELDFSLTDIKKIMTNPNYDRAEALDKHKELLLQKRNRIDRLINLVNNTIKGAEPMSFKEFDISEIEAAKKEYAHEVKERWGGTAVFRESEEKTAAYGNEEWRTVTEEQAKLLKAFGESRQLAPDSETVQSLVEAWQAHITNCFYSCDKEILAGLGLMYAADERFIKNIDQHGEGTAAFMARAIEIYCTN